MRTMKLKIFFSYRLVVFDYRTPNELSEDSPREPTQSNVQQQEDLEGKSSSTRPGRSGIVYDESGNPWDAEELEKKQKNPYRWFIDKQREKQRAKGPSQDEQAATAMVCILHI